MGIAPLSQELERQLLRYIVDNYNQRIDARMGDQTRFQRWELGLLAVPDIISERDLDICLMKQARRSVQRGGYLQFENLMYRDDRLAGYAGENVILRYDPRDITTVLVYRLESGKEVFLARADAQNLETETISLDEAKASIRKVREVGKTLSNSSILSEIRDRSLLNPPDRKTRKQRQIEEQDRLRKQTVSERVIESEVDEEEPETTTNLPLFFGLSISCSATSTTTTSIFVFFC
jgi:putative transposase